MRRTPEEERAKKIERMIWLGIAAVALVAMAVAAYLVSTGAIKHS